MDQRTTIQVSENTRKELKILASKRDQNYQELISEMIHVFNELDNKNTIISLPKKLTEKIENKIKNTDFKTVSEYLTFILRIFEYENITTDKNTDKLKQKLKSMGYL